MFGRRHVGAWRAINILDRRTVSTHCAARYDVDNSQRELHGALLDAEILADVYLMMTGGQTALFFADEAETTSNRADAFVVARIAVDRPKLRIVVATEAELARHCRVLDELDRLAQRGSVWRRERRRAVADPAL